MALDFWAFFSMIVFVVLVVLNLIFIALVSIQRLINIGHGDCYDADGISYKENFIKLENRRLENQNNTVIVIAQRWTSNYFPHDGTIEFIKMV